MLQNDHDQDFKRLMIVTVDTAVVVITLRGNWDLDVFKLWIEFGKGLDHQ